MTRPRVLLAEDHPAMATELQQLLASEYDVVDVVRDGAALIETAQRDLPDVIVSDIAMPRVNGLTAAAAILATRPAARVVFVSVLDNRAVINRALNCGALGYVLKSDVGNELLAAVRQAIDGRRYVSTNARLAIARTGGAGAKDDGRG